MFGFNENESIFMIQDGFKSRSICGENPTGEKGGACKAEIPENQLLTHPARDLGKGYKIRPSVWINPKSTFTLADIHGSGIIKHIWAVNCGKATARNLILRMYWDDCETPSVEVPFADFFFQGLEKYHNINSAVVCVNPAKAYNCYWEMPFKKHALITIENRGKDGLPLFYQIDYQERPLPQNIGYFHAQWRRENPLPYKKDYVVLDGVKGKGQYVGTYLLYGSNNNGWWGEGEFKFYIDGDDEYPTICGTGTEDYFLGAYNFEDWDKHKYGEYSGLYAGFYPLETDNLYVSQKRFEMYRLHIPDPIYFDSDIKITLQSLGWRSEGRFHPQQDDIATVAYWYLDHPIETREPLPDKDVMEMI